MTTRLHDQDDDEGSQSAGLALVHSLLEPVHHFFPGTSLPMRSR